MTIKTLPNLFVGIAFGVTDITQPPSSQTFTDVTQYVRDFTTTLGRQHMLDRFEAGTLHLTLNNRNGFFTTTHSLRARMPIYVTATWPQSGGTTYPVFYGLISELMTKTEDALNTDITIGANDIIKMLSLTYLDQPNYYKQFVETGSGNAVSWYRMDSLANQNITSGSAGIVSSTNILYDEISQRNVHAQGPTTTTSGALVYDNSVSADLTAGTGSPSAFLDLTSAAWGGAYGTTPIANFVDFWILGSNMYDQYIIPASSSTPFPNDLSLTVNSQGNLCVTNYGVVCPDVNISDGTWHHIGFGCDYPFTSGTVTVDGVAYNFALAFPLGDTRYQFFIGSEAQALPGSGFPTTALSVAGLNALIDEVVLSTGSSSFINEVITRYKEGSRLRTNKMSADMINDVIQVSGFSNFDYFVNYNTYSATTTGTTEISGYSSSVTNNTALDTILTICDTEIGSFFQDPAGKLEFLTRDYAYLSTNQSSTFTFTNYDNGYGNQVFYTAAELNYVGDDLDLWTNVKITPVNGVVQQAIASDATISLYGTSTLTKSTQPVINDSALNSAQFYAFLYGSPLNRISQIAIKSETQNGTQLPYMLNKKNIYARVNFVYRDPAGTVTQTPMIVESVSHNFDSAVGQWVSTFILDPYPVRNTTPFFILDSSSYGILGTNVLL